jgi:hypothetical protein
MAVYGLVESAVSPLISSVLPPVVSGVVSYVVVSEVSSEVLPASVLSSREELLSDPALQPAKTSSAARRIDACG